MEDTLLGKIPPEAFVAIVLALSGGWIIFTVADRNKSSSYPKYFRITAWILGLFLFFGGLTLTFIFIYPAIKEYYPQVAQDIPSLYISDGLLRWIIGLSVLAVTIFFIFRRVKFINNSKEKILPFQKQKSLKIDYSPVIVPNENMWSQKMPTYAGIRIDDEESCKGMKAKLKSVIRVKNSGETEFLKLNEVNPTNQPLRWNEKVKCMLEVVDDWSDEPRILFQDMRYYKLNVGTYELCIEISKSNIKPFEIKETLQIRKPYSRVEMKWK